MEASMHAHSSRRSFLRYAAGVCALPILTSAAARAAESRPLRVIVPFAPGGPSDVVLRVLGARWTERTGRPLIIDHRPGASGSIGAEAAKRADPDGNTLLLAPADVLVNNTAIFRTLPYDPLRDFTPVVRIGPIPLVIVAPASVGAEHLSDFAAWAKARRIGYGSWGEGSHAHLLGEALLVRRLGLDAVHAPYRGVGPMLQDLVGGQLAAGFAVPPSCAQHVQAGRLRALAVTGDRRSKVFPETPTLAELGFAEPVFGLRQWAALLAPARTAATTLVALEQELKSAFDAAEVRQTLLVAGFELDRVLGSQETQEALRAELALIPPLIRTLGVAPQ
jgi:tripartite-type tricarboxylate transporter receptor subunit TctC